MSHRALGLEYLGQTPYLEVESQYGLPDPEGVSQEECACPSGSCRFVYNLMTGPWFSGMALLHPARRIGV